jgi:hypothetical protein
MSRPATALKSQTRREVVDLVAPHYRQASCAQKSLLLDSVVASPSGQRLRRSDGNPASLKSSEIGFSFMKKTKVLELFALSCSGISS